MTSRSTAVARQQQYTSAMSSRSRTAATVTQSSVRNPRGSNVQVSAPSGSRASAPAPVSRTSIPVPVRTGAVPVPANRRGVGAGAVPVPVRVGAGAGAGAGARSGPGFGVGSLGGLRRPGFLTTGATSSRARPF
jgi:hypothetical protein